MRLLTFLEQTALYLIHCALYWYWTVPLLFSGCFLCRICSAFLPVKPGRGWRALLFIFLGGVTGMVIWVGDNNLLFTLPVFFTVFLACSRGDLIGRLTVTSIFFCLIMPVCAILDTYYTAVMHHFNLDDLIFYSNKAIRPVLWGLLYLTIRNRLPDHPPQLSPKLWKLMLLLSAMPLCAMLTVVLLPYQIYYSNSVYSLAMNLGLAVLPFVFLTSLALLWAILVLKEHEHLEQAERLASLRESYYQALQREERQVRTLRHDLRNHLTAVRGLLEQGETAKAAGYLDEMAGSPALGGKIRICENETANAVLAAKAEAMDQTGLKGLFFISLPKDLPLTDTDLCALLGNALDNAIEAAEQTKDRQISVHCRTEKGLFMLRVENAAPATLPPDLPTTKADKTAHGFGLPGMREIAERYGGTLETRQQNDRFELIACLPLRSGPQK